MDLMIFFSRKCCFCLVAQRLLIFEWKKRVLFCNEKLPPNGQLFACKSSGPLLNASPCTFFTIMLLLANVVFRNKVIKKTLH